MTIQKPNVLSYETILIDIANCDTKRFCMTIEKNLDRKNFVDLKVLYDNRNSSKFFFPYGKDLVN